MSLCQLLREFKESVLGFPKATSLFFTVCGMYYVIIVYVNRDFFSFGSPVPHCVSTWFAQFILPESMFHKVQGLFVNNKWFELVLCDDWAVCLNVDSGVVLC